MDMIDMLLGSGLSADARPTAEFEVSRLSEAIGQPFMIRARALTMREMDDLPRDGFKEHAILAAVIEPNFSDKRLAEKFRPEGRKSPLTPVEVINAVLLPGEVVNLHNEISALSGFSVNAIEKIRKN